jgi:hypothetical protein
MKTIIIKNTSRYPDNAVRWLVHFAARYVRSEFERMGFLEQFDRRGFYVEFKNKSRATYSGRYFNELVTAMMKPKPLIRHWIKFRLTSLLTPKFLKRWKIRQQIKSNFRSEL